MEKLEQKIEWYVLREKNKYGPFSYLDLVRMLQDEKLFEYDFVWHKALDSWLKVSEVEDFKPSVIQSLKTSGLKEVKDIFFRRRFARTEYNTALIVHNNKQLWRGNSLEVSAGGAGIVLNTASLEVGQEIFIHFQPGDGVPPFNATCEVVNKKFEADDRVRYSLKFIAISKGIQTTINQLAEKISA